jgi:hypothetical protein
MITQCLICRKRFEAPKHQIANVQQRTLNYLKQLAQHLIEKHTRENDAAQLQSLEYMALLRLEHFETEDPDIKTQLDYLRWRVHRATLPATVPDKNLQRQVSELAKHLTAKLYIEMDQDPQSREQMAQTLTAELYPIFEAMRNLYEEPDKYQAPLIVSPESGIETPTPAGFTRH